jgi:hypothetical protein
MEASQNLPVRDKHFLFVILINRSHNYDMRERLQISNAFSDAFPDGIPVVLTEASSPG